MSFIGDFHRYLMTRTDAPPDFHVHAALVALGHALGSRVWIDAWGGPLYPNLWVVIIAKSGYGKSVPLNMSRAMIEMAGMDAGILPSSFSQEALYDKLQARPTAIWYLQEFSSFMGLIHRDYNAGTQSWLTDMFDVPAVETRSLRKENWTIVRPCISILGASSPDWFAEIFKESALRGGFLARFLFCPSNEPGDYVGFPGARNPGIEAGLADHLRLASELNGPFDVSAVVKKFNDWDKAWRLDNVRKDCPPEFAGMRSRSGLLAWKTAMIFHASVQPDDLVLTVRDLDNAIRYIERTQGKAEKYLSEEVATDRYEVHRLKLIEIVQRGDGRIPWSKALQNSHLSARDFKAAVDTLCESERLQVDAGIGKQRFLRLPPVPIPIASNGNGRH